MSYPGLNPARLPLDRARCNGTGCGVKTDCARHLALAHMGPTTPIMEIVCDDAEEREHFILAAKEATPSPCTLCGSGAHSTAECPMRGAA